MSTMQSENNVENKENVLGNRLLPKPSPVSQISFLLFKY